MVDIMKWHLIKVLTWAWPERLTRGKWHVAVVTKHGLASIVRILRVPIIKPRGPIESHAHLILGKRMQLVSHWICSPIGCRHSVLDMWGHPVWAIATEPWVM